MLPPCLFAGAPHGQPWPSPIAPPLIWTCSFTWWPLLLPVATGWGVTAPKHLGVLGGRAQTQQKYSRKNTPMIPTFFRNFWATHQAAHCQGCLWAKQQSPGLSRGGWGLGSEAAQVFPSKSPHVPGACQQLQPPLPHTWQVVHQDLWRSSSRSWRDLQIPATLTQL